MFKIAVLVLGCLVATNAGAGSRLGKDFKLRCTQSSKFLAVKVKAETKEQTKLMQEAMLRKGTIAKEDFCILTIETR